MTSVVPANSEGEVTIVTNSRGSSNSNGNSRHSSASASRVSVEVNPASGSSSSQRPQNPPPPPAAPPPPPQTYSPEHQDEVVRVVSGRWSQYIDGGKGSPPGSSRGSNGSAAGSGSGSAGSAAGSNESVDRPGADAASPGQFKKRFGKLNVASKCRIPHLNAEPILPPPTLVQMSPGGHEKIIGLDDDDFG